MTCTEGLWRRIPALLARARALLRLPGGPPDRLSAAEIAPAARAVAALHQGLVGARALARAETYDVRDHLGAYLLWWWPQSYAKVRAACDLARLAHPGSIRILDVGAGPGPAAFALLDAMGGEATAVDASSAALAEARALDPRLPVRTVHADVARGLPQLAGVFDVAVAANFLSEVPETARDALLDALPLAPDGVVLFVEPALRETGRALLSLRDRALERGFRAVAPCLTQRPCPALSSPRDWCTAARAWDPPAHLVQLAEATGLRADEELSYAPLALARSAAVRDPDLWRVVGFAPPEKGKRRVWVCNDSGRVPLVRLDRDRAEANAALDRVERGDLVRVSGAEPRGDGLRVGPATPVDRV